MSSSPTEDPLTSFDFLSDFLPDVDFGEGFRFDEPFNFDDFGLMAHTTTIPARSLSRAVCGSVAVVVVVSGAVQIVSTARKAFCCPVGTGIFSGLV